MTVLVVVMAFVAATAAPKKQNISVLYVGGSAEFDDSFDRGQNPEEHAASVRVRMASWENFLKEYFKKVTVVHADDYTEAMSDDYDVTVFDGLPSQPRTPRHHSSVTRDYLSATYLSEDFDRPALTVGHISDRLTRSLGTKNDWYCLCLFSHAHSWRADHPIFQGPYKVKITTEERPTPEGIKSFPHHFENNQLPETMTMWRVQKYDFDGNPNVRIGMVARPGGYEDSPEAEWICGGECAKSPDAVALGRHGNFFHWGFAASPDNMTDEAKPLLANAIVYISKFAGQTPIARKYDDRVSTRESIADRKQFLSRESYDAYVISIEQHNEAMANKRAELQARLDAGEKVSEQEMFYFQVQPEEIISYDEYLQMQGRELYPLFGTDIEKYCQHFDENLPYYYSAGYGLSIDVDAKALGIANNDIALLEKAVQLWEERSDVEMGKRLLTRYTLMNFQTAGEWRQWLDANKENMFFSESAGFKWIVNSREEGANPYFDYFMRTKAVRAQRGQTDNLNPVAVTTAASILYDGSWVVTVKMAIEPGYHIYDRVSSSDVFLPTDVKFVLPEGVEAIGEVVKPQSQFYTTAGTTVYRDEAVFQQRVRAVEGNEVKVSVEWQCCDPTICFPPQSEEIVVEFR